MWLVALARTLVIAAATAEVGGPSPPLPAEVPASIPTRQTVFAIPFRVDGPLGPAEGPREVQLYVSVDGGRTWGFYAAVPPQQSSFVFHADRDGEYWFAIRTIDRLGVGRPSRVERPGMRVLVDTVPPKIALDAQRGEAGQITVRWRVSEPNLVADSFTLQYRVDSLQPWQTVALARQSLAAPGPDRGGEVTWVPPRDAARVEIRAEASDTAGNRDVCHAQVNAGADATPGNQAASSGRATRVSSAAALPPSGWRSAGHTTAYAGGPNGAAPMGGTSPNQPLEARPYPPAAQRYVPPQVPPSGQASLPPPAGPQAVNSPLFEVPYILQVGIPGAYVELWGTRDNGQTWTSFGIDSDGRSPMVVRVPGEGLYGFRFLVRSPRGVIGRPPASGDRPELWVGVDLTKPRVRIVSVEQQTSSPAAQLLIRWEATDAGLAEHPVSLLSSTTASGPWKPVATGLDGKGSFRWRVPQETSRPIYLRVEARDAAGNVGAAVMEKPVEWIAEKPHTPGGAPAGEARRPAPRRYYFR